MGNKLLSGEAGSGEGKAELGSCISSITQTTGPWRGEPHFRRKNVLCLQCPKEKFKLTENKNESDTELCHYKLERLHLCWSFKIFFFKKP